MTMTFAHAGPAAAATYYVSAEGSDENDGLSPERAWRTLGRVNSAALAPGDRALFRRGDVWRGGLQPRSGAEGAPVTYGAYGDGPKPLLLGSVDKSDPADWRDEGENLWSAGEPVDEDRPLPPGAEHAPRLTEWGLHREGGAEATLVRGAGEGATDDASLRIECVAPGTSGNHMQLSTTGLRLEAGKTYRCAFRARASQPFSLRGPVLMKTGPPWTGYSVGPALRPLGVDDQWRVFVQYYRAGVTVDDGRLTFYLGATLPAGATLFLDWVSFAECPPEEVPPPWPGALPVDVGNLIFGDEAACGVKVWNREDLAAQGQYWYDEDRQRVYLYSEGNPATRYGRIECALREHIISQGNTSWVVYEGLALKYGAAHGIAGSNTHHTTVRDCDFAFIGGGDQFGGDRTVRFGNGVEFWGNAHDNLVERCRFWEIYDAALTNQNHHATVDQYNLTYRYNVIWNCEYSFEYWNGPETSRTWNVRFINNTCVNAGSGWGHSQRGPNGRHLCFYGSPAQMRDIMVVNNIFYGCAMTAFYGPDWTREAMEALLIDHNLWYQQDGVMVSLKDADYTREQFARYQAEWGKEAHSLVGDPLFVDAARQDFRLRPGSPCVDAGADLGLDSDFLGLPVPQGQAPDLGAFELQPE